jgi:hypothetical protein
LPVLLLLAFGIACVYLWQQWQFDTVASDQPVITERPKIPIVLELPPIVPDYHIPEPVNGLAPVLSRIPTQQPVVFLGIDDGANKQDFELQMMKDNHIKASLFLSDTFIKSDRTFFVPFIRQGSLIENHTVSHKLMSSMTYEQQVQEICDQANSEEKAFGRRPVLFRPPFGDYNHDTQRVLCSIKRATAYSRAISS